MNQSGSMDGALARALGAAALNTAQGALMGAAQIGEQMCQAIPDLTVGESIKAQEDKLHDKLRDLELLRVALPESVLQMRASEYRRLGRLL